MLKQLTIIAVAISVVACAGTPSLKPAPVVAAQPPHPYAMAPVPVRNVPQAPAWFVQLPADTPEMMFAVGTATSVDEQMAYDKARMTGERKLIESLSSRVQTQTKNYRNDTGAVLIENFEQVTRKNANGELVGVRRVDSQATFDGKFYKVYVLLRLPLGEANTAKRELDQQRANRDAGIRGRAAQQDMIQNEQAHQQQELNQQQQLRKDLDQTNPNRAVPANSVNTSEGPVRFLDVENAEYKKKRDEAVAKPGAVIMQTTVR